MNIMSKLKVCRICLNKDVKMYKYDRYHLKQYYEQVMAIKVKEKDVMPKWFCFECAAILHKFHKFKEKCHSGLKVLEEILCAGPIKYESIVSIDRQSKDLLSPLDILTVNKRVRTYLIKNKSATYKYKKRKLVDVEKIEIQSDSEVSLKSESVNCDVNDDPVGNENISINQNEKISLDVEKIFDTENIPTADGNMIDNKKTSLIIEENFVDDEKIPTDTENMAMDHVNMSSDDETIPLINVKKVIDIERKLSTKKNNDKKKRKNITKSGELKSNKRNDVINQPKIRKFQTQKKRKNFLNPNNWQKFSLTEDEAEKEFKARAESHKYLKANFKCTDCFKGFSKEDMLNRHKQLRHVESVGQIVCRFCKMRFKWDCFLRRHMRQHYNKYKCMRCDLICPLETTALFHEEYHNGVIRKCVHCGEEFKHMSTYYTHLRTHRSAHVCTLCGASFVSQAGLHRHKIVKHVNANAEPRKDGEVSHTYCERCDIRFETMKAYEEHLIHSAMHAEGVEDLAEEIPAPSNPKKRRKFLKRNPRKPTTCNKCGKHYSTQTAFMKHHLAEHPRTPLLAPNERHICEICGISLAPVSVANHLNTHTRKNLFTCSTCGLQVNSKGSLTRHQLTHSGDKPYPCQLCDKRFTQKGSMNLHYRTFHLKQPYPKRNRRRKTDEIPLADDIRNQAESVDTVIIDRWR